jgi:hypothetical protein
MTRAVLGGALLVAVVAGGFVVGAINTLTKECWPDLDGDDR